MSTGLHMYCWSVKPNFIAVAQAKSVDHARRLLLDQIGESGDGSCPERDYARKDILETTPTIWHYANAEFALTDSAELREVDAEHLRNIARQAVTIGEYQEELRTVKAERDSLKDELGKATAEYYTKAQQYGARIARHEQSEAEAWAKYRELKAVLRDLSYDK